MKNIKKAACLMLTLLLAAACCMPAYAADTASIQLVNAANPTGGIAGFAIDAGETDLSKGQYHYVWFGTGTQDTLNTSGPLQWRVLDTSDNTGAANRLFMQTQKALGSGTKAQGGILFDTDSFQWDGSDAQAWCNTFETNNLSTRELAAVAKINKTETSTLNHEVPVKYMDGRTGTVTYQYFPSVLVNDQVFFLSGAEAAKESYGFSNTQEKNVNQKFGETFGLSGTSTISRAFLLRSEMNNGLNTQNFVGVVFGNSGNLHYVNLGDKRAARPALNVDMSKVLLTSAAEYGKHQPGMTGGIEAVGSDPTREWKLTLLDEQRKTPSVGTIAVEGTTLTLAYEAELAASSSDYLSVVTADANGKATHYGRLKGLDERGAVQLDISGVPADATIYLFSEEYHGPKATDYASKLTPISRTKNAYAVTYAFLDGSIGVAQMNENYTATLLDENQKPLSSVSVTVDGKPLQRERDYTYDSSTGELVIDQAAVTGNIVISQPQAATGAALPQTGDDANLMLWLGLMLVSGVCAGVMMRRKKA